MPGTNDQTQNVAQQPKRKAKPDVSFKPSGFQPLLPPSIYSFVDDNHQEEKENIYSMGNNTPLLQAKTPKSDSRPKSSKPMPPSSPQEENLNQAKPSSGKRWLFAGLLSLAVKLVGIFILTTIISIPVVLSGPLGWAMVGLGFLGVFVSVFKLATKSTPPMTVVAAPTAPKPKTPKMLKIDAKTDKSFTPQPSMKHQTQTPATGKKGAFPWSNNHPAGEFQEKRAALKKRHQRYLTFAYAPPVLSKEEQKITHLKAENRSLKEQIEALEQEQRLKAGGPVSSAFDAPAAPPPPPPPPTMNYHAKGCDPLAALKAGLDKLTPEQRAARKKELETKAAEEVKKQGQADLAKHAADIVNNKPKLSPAEIEAKLQREKLAREQSSNQGVEDTLNTKKKLSPEEIEAKLQQDKLARQQSTDAGVIEFKLGTRRNTIAPNNEAAITVSSTPTGFDKAKLKPVIAPRKTPSPERNSPTESKEQNNDGNGTTFIAKLSPLVQNHLASKTNGHSRKDSGGWELDPNNAQPMPSSSPSSEDGQPDSQALNGAAKVITSAKKWAPVNSGNRVR